MNKDISFTSNEKFWLMNQAWTFISCRKTKEAQLILEYILDYFPHDIKIKKMLIVAYFRNQSYAEVVDIADRLLEQITSSLEIIVIKLCRSRALAEIGNTQQGIQDYNSYMEALNGKK